MAKVKALKRKSALKAKQERLNKLNKELEDRANHALQEIKNEKDQILKNKSTDHKNKSDQQK